MQFKAIFAVFRFSRNFALFFGFLLFTVLVHFCVCDFSVFKYLSVFKSKRRKDNFAWSRLRLIATTYKTLRCIIMWIRKYARERGFGEMLLKWSWFYIGNIRALTFVYALLGIVFHLFSLFLLLLESRIPKLRKMLILFISAPSSFILEAWIQNFS